MKAVWWGGPRAPLGGGCVAHRGELIGVGAVLRTGCRHREACREAPRQCGGQDTGRWWGQSASEEARGQSTGCANFVQGSLSTALGAHPFTGLVNQGPTSHFT